MRIKHYTTADIYSPDQQCLSDGPTLHATQVSAFIPGCCALLHMFVFHMVTAVHCKSAPLQPPLSVCSSFTRYLWDHLSSISAWTSLGRGLPLCLAVRSQRLYFKLVDRNNKTVNVTTDKRWFLFLSQDGAQLTCSRALDLRLQASLSVFTS